MEWLQTQPEALSNLPDYWCNFISHHSLKSLVDYKPGDMAGEIPIYMYWYTLTSETECPCKVIDNANAHSIFTQLI